MKLYLEEYQNRRTKKMTKTINKVIQKESVQEFEEAMNKMNEEENTFATHTHVTVVGGVAKYTAVFFIRGE